MFKIINHFLQLFCLIVIVSACSSSTPKDRPKNLNLNSNSLAIPNLTGLWELNTELSENPLSEIKQHMRKSDNSEGNKGKNGRGDGNHQGNGGGKGTGGKRSKGKANNRGFKALPQELHALLIAPKSMGIKHEEPLLTIITQAGQEQIYTDFRSSSVSSTSNKSQKVTIAGWEDNILFVEHTLSSGRFIQQVSINPNSGQLQIETLILTPHLPKQLKFTRFYDLISTDTK